jgi:hypothetical protein
MLTSLETTQRLHDIHTQQERRKLHFSAHLAQSQEVLKQRKASLKCFLFALIIQYHRHSHSLSFSLNLHSSSLNHFQESTTTATFKMRCSFSTAVFAAFSVLSVVCAGPIGASIAARQVCGASPVGTVAQTPLLQPTGICEFHLSSVS